MNQFIFINKIRVQDANCVAGLTWGFPSITGFTGFAHALSLKVQKSDFSKIRVGSEIMVVAHDYHHHTYENEYQITLFSQKRGANFYSDTDKNKQSKTMTRIEEGRMDMVISLLIPIQGRVGANRKEAFIDYLIQCVSTMRIASGSVISIKELDVLGLDESNKSNQLLVKRKLMPGYVLSDASSALSQHYDSINSAEKDLVDAWLDFSSIKYQARPENTILGAYFDKLSQSDDASLQALSDVWQNHLAQPYQQTEIPNRLKQYFTDTQHEISEEVLSEWSEYCDPNEDTKAKWEFVGKPQQGYLVPIMNGYRRISEDVSDIDNLRGIKSTSEINGDFEQAYFAEATYSVANWVFVRRINFENFSQYFWQPQCSPELGLYTCVMPSSI